MIAAILRETGRLLTRLRYRIRLSGQAEILGKGRTGMLILPNHPALVDPVIVVTELLRAFRPYTLADRVQVGHPVIGAIAATMNVHPIPDVAVEGEACRAELEAILEDCVRRLRKGENVMLWPAGRVYRSRLEDLGGNSAAAILLREVPDARVVLVRTRGLWGSLFSRAAESKPNFIRSLLKAIPFLLASFVFFCPRRRVTLELIEPADVPRGGDRNTLNRYLENFYNQDAPPNTWVPHTFWQGFRPRVRPEPPELRSHDRADGVPSAVRGQVLQYLQEKTGITQIRESDSLARDLSLDSLVRAELQTWVRQEFGHPVEEPEALQTVADMMMAAHGQTMAAGPAELKPIPARWFRPAAGAAELTVAPGDNIGEVFLYNALRFPGRAILADQSGGMRTYRDVLTAIHLLRPFIAALEGEYLGIMLPASAGATILYLTTLFAGKTPVMVNWTTGMRYVRHSLDLLDVRHILTSDLFLKRLEGQGADFSALADRLVRLESLRKKMTLGRKVGALLKARFRSASLAEGCCREKAVVLFTSGSENLPKAVPLTHANILANIRDIFKFVTIYPNDRILGMLPPFHAFGLTCTVVLPVCTGLGVAYHPNPTEGRALARLIQAYRISWLVGTPTFLAGIMQAADGKQLNSLKMVITGAEKCPAALYGSIAARYPGLTVLEGYGITECSPVIAGNWQSDPKPFTIGRVLESFEYALRDVDTGMRTGAGQSGMLLVRGPCVFDGYLNYDGPSPFESFEDKTWYRTGDLVREEPDGTLVFVGRLKRFVKLGGEMVSLPAVEEVLLKAFPPAGEDGPPLAVDSSADETAPELILFCVRDISRETANRAIKEAGLSPLHNIRRVFPVEKIPVLGTGKTDYRSLRAMIQEVEVKG